MVQCAVGNRCKKCASRFTSHVLKVTPLILLRLTAAMAALGVAFGYAEPKFHYMPFGIYGYIVFFFIFSAIGKAMQRVASYKQGPKVFVSALFGLTLGLAIGPFREMFLATLNPPPDIPNGTLEVQSPLFMEAAIFICAVLWPFARKN